MILLTELLISLLFIFVLLYFWIKYKFNYWEQNGLPYIQPTSIFGNLKDVIFVKQNIAETLQNFYNYKNLFENEPLIGIYLFHKPALLIREPELIKRILIKDFNKFSDRFSTSDPHIDTLAGNNLFFLKNPEWKVMRSKLSPTFTSGKMKQMFSLVDAVGKQLDAYMCELTNASKVNSTNIDVKDTCALFTTDVIASTAFGIEVNSIKNPNCEFRVQGKKLFNFTVKKAIDFVAIFFLPHLAPFLRSKIFTKESSIFLRSVINNIMMEREKSGISRNDLIDTLITLKNASKKENTDKNQIKFEDDVLVAQAAVFFTAGFETTSSTMGFLLFELAKNVEAQNRLREEIKDLLMGNDGEITYDAIQNMEYINQVIQEALRMYPPLAFLDRQCILTKDENGYSLEPFSDYKIPNGMSVYIPIYAIQRDSKYFPEPNDFKPDRFDPENRDSVLSSVYMPFGNGPHNCIGERFALMQMKIGLIYFFKNHYVRPSKNSPKNMILDKKSFVLQAKDGINCEIIHDPLLK